MRVRLTPLDSLLGFQKTIAATWYFQKTIDAGQLRMSLARLVRRHPALGGRVMRPLGWHHSALHGFQVCSHEGGPGVMHVRHEPGTSWDAAAVPDPKRQQIHHVPTAAVMSGRAPPFAAMLTNFASGGSSLGIAMSHALVDAHGFYSVVREWARLHAIDDDHFDDSDLIFDRECTEVAEERAAQLGTMAEVRALDLTSWRGSALFGMLRMLSSGSSPPSVAPRTRLVLSRRDVNDLRRTCRVDGVRWRPSKAEALVASVARAVTRSLRLPPAATCQLQMVFDARAACRLPGAYVGNAFHLLSAAPSAPPPHDVPLSEVLDGVHALSLRAFVGNTWDDPHSLAGGWLRHQQLLRAGRLPLPGGAGTASGAEATAIIANYQAHLPAFRANFGAGSVLRVVPSAGDTLQMVAGADGGVDVYLNLARPLGNGPDLLARLREDVLDPR